MSQTHQNAGSESPENRQPPQTSESLVLIWDLPTRVFHWLLAASFFIALASGDSDRFRDIHVFSGYLILGLICFRVVCSAPARPSPTSKRFSPRGLAGTSATTRRGAGRSSRCWPWGYSYA
jgi:cytochrome b